MGVRGGWLFPEVDGSARDLPQHGAEGLLPPDRVSFRRRVNARGDLGHGKPQVDQGPCFAGSKHVGDVAVGAQGADHLGREVEQFLTREAGTLLRFLGL